MKKQYNFDSSCEFTGTTKENVIAGMSKWDSECKTYKLGDYTFREHPLYTYNYEEYTGRTFEEMLSAVIEEFSEGGSVYDALCNIYKFYDDTFDDGKNSELLSGTIGYMMQTIYNEYRFNGFPKGTLPKSFKTILENDK